MPEFGRGGRGGGYGMGGGMRGGRGGRFNSGGNEDHLDPEHEQYRKLFVGGLSYETTTEGLKGHFEKHGEIVDCVVMKDPHTKRSRGFGFVTFKEAAMLDDAQENRPHKIDGRETETKRAMPREESGRSESQQSVTKLFIGGCKDDTTEDHLRDTFGSFGEIEKIDLITDRTTGKTKGFSFVTFKDYDSVDKCVLKKVHNLNGRNVEVKKAENKEEKAARAARGGGMMSMGQGWGGDQGFGGQAYGRGQGGLGGGGYGGRGGYGGGYGNQGGFGGGGGGSYNNSWGAGGYDSGYGGGYNQGGGGGGGNWGAASGGGDFSSGYGNNYGAGYGSAGGGGTYGNSSYGGGGSGNYGSSGGTYGGGSNYGNSNYGGGGGNYGGYNRR